MAHRILGHNAEGTQAPSPENLKRAFETAVCEIRQADRAAKKSDWYHIPIVRRARIPGFSRADAEKRALSDAARALAQLWKV